MKVLMVLTCNRSYDGITVSVMNLCKHMDKTSILVDFVVHNDLPVIFLEQLNKAGSTVFSLPMRNRNPVGYINKLKRIIKDGGYDIVHAHGNSATLFFEMFSAKLAGCNIRISHSHNTTCSHKIADKLLRPLFYRSYTNTFACDRSAGLWLFKNRRFTVINNGIDLNKFRFNEELRSSFRKKYQLENKTVIGHVGAFNSQKNHEFLIDIFAKLLSHNSDYHLILVGDGDLRSSVECKIKSMGISDHVLFTGTTDDVHPWLQTMDILVFPSLYEGLPCALIEAQASGLPCLVSDTITQDAGLSELVHFYPLKYNTEKWSQMITKIIESKSNRAEIRNKAIEDITAQGYDIKTSAAKLKDLYGTLIEND